MAMVLSRNFFAMGPNGKRDRIGEPGRGQATDLALKAEMPLSTTDSYQGLRGIFQRQGRGNHSVQTGLEDRINQPRSDLRRQQHESRVQCLPPRFHDAFPRALEFSFQDYQAGLVRSQVLTERLRYDHREVPGQAR